ncbi:type IV toxin-antitoxin system AbiEi family antitoxin domain-containing protein [Sedimentibacter sp.]|uniref:type IV toxin-antitoxin system AbiEi family antitoxin domain-containing protein n=1 Tax=Sedimentibacter sp. TaxID=1960295 RepID=UPI0028AB8BBE|nr:type IV toxin-antitoxin system AbiEi family antitoxin domain-containing protein [Sedimentibacter sp.]
MIDKIKNEFDKYGGVLKTTELNTLGLSSRQIKKLLEEGVISKIKYGFYELKDEMPREEVVIARLFPNAVIFLESALMYYGYTDRIPSAWQIAVDRYSKTTKYDINYPLIEPFYLEPKFLEVGISTIPIGEVSIRIYDRERTMCDVLRYENKLDREVFINSIQRYIRDSNKNMRQLFEYAKIFNVNSKVQTYIGVWV